MAKTKPNIIVTGTPGVGKTSHCDLLARNTGLKHLRINQIVKERGCHDGWSEKFQSFIVDEDKLLDLIENDVKQGGFIIEWHACDLFPRSWIDLVVVLRTSTANLYDRLKARQYSERKLQENLDSEIMEVILEEARESHDGDSIMELQSNSPEDIESNVERIETWIDIWKCQKIESDAS